MIVKKTRSARLNLGNYQHLEVYASMELNSEVDTAIFEASEGDLTKVYDYIDDQLMTFMQDDIYQGRHTTTLDPEDSAAHALYRLNYSNNK